MEDISNEQLVNAMIDEWNRIEKFRKDCLVYIIGICRSMHNLRVKLTEEMISVLVENKWKEGEATKALAASVAALMKAVEALKGGRRFDKDFLDFIPDDEEIT